MESSWLETHWARPFHLTLVFCLTLGLLQAIKLYLQRQRLLRDLRPFPSPPTHWFYAAEGCGPRVRALGLRGAGNHVFRPLLAHSRRSPTWRSQKGLAFGVKAFTAPPLC